MDNEDTTRKMLTEESVVRARRGPGGCGASLALLELGLDSPAVVGPLVKGLKKGRSCQLEGTASMSAAWVQAVAK